MTRKKHEITEMDDSFQDHDHESDLLPLGLTCRLSGCQSRCADGAGTGTMHMAARPTMLHLAKGPSGTRGRVRLSGPRAGAGGPGRVVVAGVAGTGFAATVTFVSSQRFRP